MNAPATKELSPVAQFSGFMDKLKPQIARALPAHMNAERMARLALTSFSTNADLRQCDMSSIAGAIMTAAQLGLEPGIGGQGYLIPYKGKCTFVPGWKGLVDLAARSGRATVWTGVVRPGDEFEYQLGDTPFCKHKPGDEDDDALFDFVYAIGRVKDADMPVIEVWSRAKVLKHLKKYNKVGTKHYAVGDEHNLEMYARKVALLQVLKYMPSSIELANAITASNAAEDGRGVTIENGIVVDTGGQYGHNAEDAGSGKAELPECTAEQFAELSKEWETLLRARKKTTKQAISTLSTVFILTDEQKMQIDAWHSEGS